MMQITRLQRRPLFSPEHATRKIFYHDKWNWYKYKVYYQVKELEHLSDT